MAAQLGWCPGPPQRARTVLVSLLAPARVASPPPPQLAVAVPRSTRFGFAARSNRSQAAPPLQGAAAIQRFFRVGSSGAAQCGFQQWAPATSQAPPQAVGPAPSRQWAPAAPQQHSSGSGSGSCTGSAPVLHTSWAPAALVGSSLSADPTAAAPGALSPPPIPRQVPRCRPPSLGSGRLHLLLATAAQAVCLACGRTFSGPCANQLATAVLCSGWAPFLSTSAAAFVRTEVAQALLRALPTGHQLWAAAIRRGLLLRHRAPD